MTRPEGPQAAAAPPPIAAPPSPSARSAAEARAAAAAARHRLVILSILLVAAALATMLCVQFFVSALGAILAGACTAAIILLVHDQVGKAAEIARLKRELSRTQAAGHTASHGQTQGASPLAAEIEHARAAAQQATQNGAQEQQGAPTAPVRRRRVSVLDAQQASDSQAAQPAAATDPAPDARPAMLQPAQKMPGDPLRDQWAFRPRDPSMAVPPPAPHSGAYGDVVATAPASTIETDLALVQRKIKALADEVNATEAARPAPFDPRSPSGAALESSIDALKAAAGSMRERPHHGAHQPASTSSSASSGDAVSYPPAAAPQPFFEFSIPATAERIAASSPPVASGPAPAFPDLPTASLLPPSSILGVGVPPSASQSLDMKLALPDFLETPHATLDEPAPRVAAISKAIEAGRMDVLLSPIVGLQNHDVSHYSLEVRLKSEEGPYFETPESDLVLAAGDMLALFDAARLQRAAHLARRLDARGKGGSLLSDVAGPSLTNGDFLETFARLYEQRERIAGQLVLTFSQSDCEQFTAPAWQALGDMHSFGFRFALDSVRHLDSDFDELARRGFAFVKFDAEALLNGVPASDRFAPAPEACRRIAAAGLTLIADSVDSEAARARLLAAGVLFGQGELFGGARRVSDGATAGQASTQAA